MLNYDICQQCKVRYEHNFLKFWNLGLVYCGCVMKNNYYSTLYKVNEPPIECPYVLEHIVNAE
jgi:hypothetical protein